jgi:hypothetical protein
MPVKDGVRLHVGRQLDPRDDQPVAARLDNIEVVLI